MHLMEGDSFKPSDDTISASVDIAQFDDDNKSMNWSRRAFSLLF